MIYEDVNYGSFLISYMGLSWTSVFSFCFICVQFHLVPLWVKWRMLWVVIHKCFDCDHWDVHSDILMKSECVFFFFLEGWSWVLKLLPDQLVGVWQRRVTVNSWVFILFGGTHCHCFLAYRRTFECFHPVQTNVSNFSSVRGPGSEDKKKGNKRGRREGC